MKLFKLIFFLVSGILFAQENGEQNPQEAQIVSVNNNQIDTLQLKDLEKSPLKASLYSAIAPGAGQIYNKKYWKAPLVWGLLGAGGGIIIYYNKEYNRFRDAFIAELNGETHEFTDFNFTPERLAELQDDRRRVRDYAIVITALIYVLNILDATVDAHLFEFDKNPDLAWSLQPSLIQNPTNFNPHFGIRLQLKL